ncbi:prepilin-type N-terminal cleavage/methylation domain-containing protein [Patescibacteria group bacterium]|nr:prepilin-type N-terminal cleavage/methylation domain-containing protein [Patescibacteria group bacterium]
MKPVSVRNLRVKGFTLIELLVVIAIIGLLVTAAVASFSYVRERARDTKRVSDMKTMQKALEMYLTTNSRYPIAAADTCLTNADVISQAVKNAGAMIEVPVDPYAPWVADPTYCYLYKQNDGTDFQIVFTLERTSPVGQAGPHVVGP